MRNYVKPESELIALNMSENIAASAGPKEIVAESKTKVVSDATGSTVANSNLDWDTFVTTTSGWSNISVGNWLTIALGSVEAFNELRAACIVDL